ncbi:MAG: hypothetical protein WC444_06980 [Candidatus Paceibacterota bacterium]
MNKAYKAELERQIKSRTVSMWLWALVFIGGVLLSASIIFAVIGVPLIIVALIFAYRAENKRKSLSLELLKG